MKKIFYLTLALAVFLSAFNLTVSADPATPVPYDPNSNLSDDYEYIWGDDFEGTALNQDNWSSKSSKMGGGGVLIVEDTPQTISVQNGALKLTAYKAADGSYHVPSSVHTQRTMNYKY